MLVHKRSTKLVRDAGWYSELEMKVDLKWTPCFGFNSLGSPLRQRIKGAISYCQAPERVMTQTRPVRASLGESWAQEERLRWSE